MQQCLFCKIAGKEISSHVVYENAEVFAFLDIHPCALGHTVVVPKQHAENILELSGDETAAFFRGVQLAVRRVDEVLSPAGFTLGINHGRVSGQAIDHLHLHIIPRYAGDGGGSLHTIVQTESIEPIEAVAAKFSAAG